MGMIGVLKKEQMIQTVLLHVKIVISLFILYINVVIIPKSNLKKKFLWAIGIPATTDIEDNDK